MSPKNIYSLLKNFIRKIESVTFRNTRVAIDGTAMTFFTFKNARKEYHASTFSVENAVNALKNPESHEKLVAEFSKDYAMICFEKMIKMFPKSVIIFDGGCPAEKNKEFQRRKRRLIDEQSRLAAAKFNFEMDLQSQERAEAFYTALGEYYEHRKWHIAIEGSVIETEEADRTCAKMCIRGDVDAVFSPDYDLLAYLCPVLIRDVDDTNADIIVLADVLQGLQISKQQFVDMCILMGTDYNDKIPQIGPKTALKLIREYGSLENIELNSDLDISCLDWRKGRQIYDIQR